MEAVRAVDGRGLIERLVDAGDGCQINDGAPSGFLPDIGNDEDGSERALVIEQIPVLANAGDEQLADFTDHAGGAQQVQHDTGHEDPGQEVREGVNGLQHLLIARHVHFIDHDGQQDREREAEENTVERNDQRVAQRRQELRLAHHVFEVSEVIPRAGGNALEDVVLKGELNAVHGNVLEDDEIRDTGNQHQINPAVFPHGVQRFLRRMPLFLCDLNGHGVTPSSLAWCGGCRDLLPVLIQLLSFRTINFMLILCYHAFNYLSTFH